MISPRIEKYLTDTVDIVRVTLSEGSRSTVTIEDVVAKVSNRVRVVRDTSGDHLEAYTVVFLLSNQAIDGKDEVVVDGVTRPVKDICKPGTKRGVHHLEVELN